MFFKPQLFKVIQIITILFATSTIFSQTTIWTEDFSTYGNGVTVGTGNRWTTTTIAGFNYFEVRSNQFHARDTDQKVQIFSTENINISSYTNVSLSVDIFEVAGDFEGDDYVDVYYILDGGAETLFTTNGSNTEDFGSTVASQTGLNGSTIQIIIKIENGTGNLEVYGFDNILVEGFFSGPEINLIGNGTSILNGDTTPTLGDDTDFGNIDIASGNNVNIFSIENNGTSDLTITSVAGGTADFVINGTTSGTITPGNSMLFTVTFDPTTVGTKTATISIVNDDTTGGENPYIFDIQGVGTEPTYSEVTISVTWPAYSSENRVEIYSPSGTLITTIDNGYTGGTDNSYGPITFNLGCLEDLNNYYFIMYDTANDGWDGTDNITITSSGVEVVNQNGNSASSGGTSVNFNVSGGICGAEINVTGNGTSIADGETVTSPGNYTDFGNIDISTSFTGTFTIENTGGADLTIGATVTLATATLFSVTTQPSSTLLTTGASTTFVITFSPVAVGTFTDVVTITNDDSNENPYTFTVQGTGSAPLTEGPGGVVGNLQLWLKSTDGLGYADGSDVSLWQTQARGSNAAVNTVGQEPTYYDNATNNVNFNPVVSFLNDRTNAPEEYDYTYTPQQYLEGSSGFYTQEIFVVAIPNDVIDNTYASMDLFCGDSPLVVPTEDDGTGLGYGRYTQRFDTESITYAIGTTNDTSNPADTRGYGIADTNIASSYSGIAILNVRDNISSPVDGSELYYNGKNIESEEVGVPQFINVENSRFWIGRSQGYRGSFEGRVTEVITYSSRKSDTDLTDERNKIQSYLAIKYGITLGVNSTSQDYVDSDGTVIWDQSANVGYNYDIAGIGRDDVSELNQKQSKTVNTTDDITIGLNEIATTNNLNANTFASDKTFLVWGNDNATLAAQPAIFVDMSSGIGGLSTTVDFTAIGRIWKVVEKGTVGKAKISIPESMLSATLTPPGDYLMFISSDGTFSPTSEYRIMSLNGTDLETAYDFPTDGTKYITFGFAPEKTVTRSIQFDGVVDYLDAGDVLDIKTPTTTAFTISAWIKRENIAASIVSKRDNGFTTGYNFGIDGSGNLEMSWNGGSETITSSVPIPASKWHHVAIIYDGTTAKLYIDGVEDVTKALAAPIANSESFLIAAADGDEVNTTSFFQGNIDEVRVWDIALTEDQLRFVINQEIEDNTNVDGSYFAGLGITPTKNDINAVPWANLKGYYPMSTYTFTNCKDASGNGNTAALKNLNTVDHQTAPLPYVSDADGGWDTPATWLNNTVQNLPNSFSIVDGVTRIDWNIVEISDNNIITSGASRNISILGLNMISNTADGIDTELTINGDTATGIGNGLTITHYLKLDGVLDLQGESQLIQTTGSDLDAASTGYLERDQQGEGNLYRYNYWSSPVYTANDLIGGNFTTVSASLRDGSSPDNVTYPRAISFTGGYNGSVGPPITLSTYWMFKYANKSGAYSEWVHVGSAGEIYSGEGFTMKGTKTPGGTSQNYVFQGKPNNGTITLNVTTNNSYLVGNPYASAIDGYQFITDNASTITGPLYFWEHYGGDSHNLQDYQGGYATLSLGGGLPAASAHADVNQTYPGVASLKTPGQFIPIGQSFYVVGDAIDGGDIEFNNGQRTFKTETELDGVGDPISVFMKNSNTKSKTANVENSDKRPKYRIGFNAPKISHRQLLLTIDENASDAVDWGYDAKIFGTIKDDMYWMIDNEKYVIQATNTLTLDKEIPLGIQTEEGGLISIMVDVLENVDENTSIYIKDKLNGETYDITNQAFEINLEAGEYLERIVLTFQPRLKTLEEVALVEGVHIFMNNTISELQVNKIVATEIVNVNLFNYLGQQVNTWNINTDERFISLPIQITTGVYIVQVNTTAGVITKKVIIE